MAEPVGVLVWLPGPDEPEVVARLDAVTGARVVRRCADLAELLGAAHAGIGTIAVLSLSRGVDRARLADLARAGARTVLVAGPADLHRAGALGAHALVAEGRQVAANVAEIVADLVSHAPRRTVGVERVAAEADHAMPDGAASVPGRVLAVWSGSGAPGRSTIAATLAAELARLGRRTLLVDADTAAPALAQILGLLDEGAGIAALSRAAGQGTLDREALLRRAVLLPCGAGFVSGLTRADRWRELPGEHMDVVLEACRREAQWSVVDLAAGLEPAPARGADRQAAARSVLAQADLVLVVAAPDPVGVRRAVQALGELDDESAVGVPAASQLRRILLNATRPTPSRTMHGAQEALARFGGMAPAWTVPYDEAVASCLLAGRTLTEGAPRSAARRVLATLARELVGEPEPGGRRRTRPAVSSSRGRSMG